MLLAVGQTILLAAIGWTVSHHLLNNAYENASEHRVWKEFADYMELISNSTSTNGPHNITSTNGTVLANNQTLNGAPNNFTLVESHADFYGKTLPKEIFVLAVISPLYYWWHIWLEKTV